MRRVLVLSLFLLSHCGGGDGGTGLSISIPAGEATIDADLRFGGLYVSNFVGGDGEATLVWPQFESDSSSGVFGQSIHFDLTLGEGGPVDEGSRDSKRPSACRHENGLAVTWSDGPAEYPVGVTLNESDVAVMMSWPPSGESQIVNPNSIGFQEPFSLACLADGRRVVAWNSFCTAMRRTGDSYVRFRPQDCNHEPADGSYLRILDADGTPSSAPIRNSDDPVTLLAPTGGDAFVAVTNTRIQSWQGDVLVDEVETDLRDPVLACVDTHCAAPSDGTLMIFDAEDLSSQQVFAFHEESMPSPTERIYPRDANVACDTKGTCVFTWVLVHDSWGGDAFVSETLGVHAVAFDVRLGDYGETVLLRDPAGYDYGALVASTGPGSFLLTSLIGEDSVVQRLVID